METTTTQTEPSLSAAQAIELGIGLAPLRGSTCTLCKSRRLACPRHAAENVVRVLAQEGYVVAVAAPPTLTDLGPGPIHA